jgi:hypothetical protein
MSDSEDNSNDSSEVVNDSKTPKVPKTSKKAANDQTSAKPRSAVGRPPKKIERREIPKYGIMQKPSNLESAEDPALVYAVELLYINTGMFKKIFSLFKNLKVEETELRFCPDGLKMFSVDKMGTSKIFVNIYGRQMNWYYTKNEVIMKCSISSFRKRIQNISKEASEIRFCSTENDIDKVLRMTFCNASQISKSKDNINIQPLPLSKWDIEDVIAKEKKYKLHFEIGSKNFKEIVNSFNTQVKEFNILKSGTDILKFVYDYTDDLGDHEEEFDNPSKINLISHVEDDEVFSVKVQLNRIKALVSSIITKNIKVSVDEQGPIIFTMNLDEDVVGNQEKKIIPRTEKAYIKIITDLTD